MTKAARRELRSITTGVVVTLVILAVLGIVFGSSNGVGGSSYRVFANFNKTDGLDVGSPVWAAGVPVGQVEALELTENFKVRAVLRIEGGVELDSEASAAIVTDGIFGSKLVRVDIGGGEKLIADGGSIAFTEDAVVLDDLMALIVSRARAKQDAGKMESAQ
jgi:phospholipid/cholesterol/gamma-HCH transport system substrate-binding protein